MECQWKDCDEYIEEDITQHIQKHIEKQTEYACMWKGCKRYNEKQSNKYTLQAHVRKHTNEKPYKCTKCTKKYTRSDALNKHTKNHLKVETELEEHISLVDSLWYRKRMMILNTEYERLNVLRKKFEKKILYDLLSEETEKELKN